MEYTRNLSWLLGEASELQMQTLRKYINDENSHVKDICSNIEVPSSKINRRQRSNDELTEVSDLMSIIVALFLVISVVIVGGAETWKPYDDFSQGFNAVDQQPGEVKFGKKWIRYVPEARLKMAIENEMLLFKVNAPGGRDPGFKLGFGWEEKDIIGIQFTVKVAELSKAGGWFGVLCTDQEPNWKGNNWVFGVSPSHQHNWGPKTYFGSGSVGNLGGWKSFAYNDIPENTNMLRTFRLVWNNKAHQMSITIDPEEKTEWHKADVHSNSDLGKFPWWSIYLTADQTVKVIIDDIYIQSESLPYSVTSNSNLATKWAAIK